MADNLPTPLPHRAVLAMDEELREFSKALARDHIRTGADPDQVRYRNLLRDLGATVNEKAATDPAAALTLVARLPIFAEKLLGLPAPASR